MKKSGLKALFINAKANDAKYIGVRIEAAGSRKPEIIINPRENFDAIFKYYMEAYDDDLILVSAKGKKDIRITGVAQGGCFEDIEVQLMDVIGTGWKQPISDAIERAYENMIAETPFVDEEEREKCEVIKEAIKGAFINESRTAAEARFIVSHINEYEKIFNICMSGSDKDFKKGLIELQRMQNEELLREERESVE